MKRRLHSLAFALVFLPPRKEVENWTTIKSVALASDRIKEFEKVGSGLKPKGKANGFAGFSFSYNGLDTIAFYSSRKTQADWKITTPAFERSLAWASGAWSGLSVPLNEIHHFFARPTSRGFEPKYRSYSLSPNAEVIDFDTCDAKHAFLLQTNAGGTPEGPLSFYLTAISQLAGQDLSREKTFSFSLPSRQEILKVHADSCTDLQLDGWPKSFKVDLR